MLRLFVLSSVLLLSLTELGCASYFKRKSCEETNWFEHGHKVAMSGKRLDADDFIKECQKVEAHFSLAQADSGFKAGMAAYCTDDNVFTTGKNGTAFSFDMCDGVSAKRLHAQYNKGLEIFCTPSNAYRFGASGGVYNNVCPKASEDAWLAEYRRGRKVYLAASIESKESRIRSLQSDIISAQSELTMLLMRQSDLRRKTTTRQEFIHDPQTGAYQERLIQEPDPSAQREADGMDYDIRNKQSRIKSDQSSVEELNQEISRLRMEMATL